MSAGCSAPRPVKRPVALVRFCEVRDTSYAVGCDAMWMKHLTRLLLESAL
jgi:hypothetical protein